MVICVILVSCSSNDNHEKENLFVSKKSSSTGIDFKNILTESDSLNYFTYSYLYMGGGVATGDFNNDGLEDVFFTANQEKNKLYINQGNLKFKDITKFANVAGDSRWYTGVSLVDINADGWLDIYLSVSGPLAPRNNELYINNGDLTFTESAEKYGVNDPGASIQGTFFDYDRDNDLDLLVINYSSFPFNAPPEFYRNKMDNPKWIDSDHIYENIDGHFVDRTKEAGLLNFGLTISASVSDFNNDGWLDFYLCNDFASPDYFFINNGDGTFKDNMQKAFAHTPLFCMGSDAADINDDGFIDLMQLDMNPPNHFRNKSNMASMDIARFWKQVDNGLHYQYMQNSLQLNSGILDSIPRFSDISKLTGISSTDWSWSALFFDVNNDAKKDLFITNGIRRDINNRDFFMKMEGKLMFANAHKYYEASLAIPSKPIANFLFLNETNMEFSNVSEIAGIAGPSFSNGMAYSDLDNDGDLDIVINNVDQEAFVYENKIKKDDNHNYIQIELEGEKNNKKGIGSRVEIKTKEGIQLLEQMPVRGFQSTVSDVLHFGLGQTKKVDTITVKWSDGKISLVTNVSANQKIIITKKDTTTIASTNTRNTKNIFKNIEDPNNILDFVHKENDFDDFDIQILLPHKMSQFGPGMTVGDFNKDGKDDVFFGGSSGKKASLYFQNNQGKFIEQEQDIFENHKIHEGIDAIAFDFDNDEDLDLYVVSGGNEFEPDNDNYKDRLYINNGEGKFSDGSDLLPKNTLSGSVVKPADFDNDGDLDLFIGTRHLPHNYPLSQPSVIYENTGNGFINVTETIAPELLGGGMITDAVWVDINNDKKLDLIVVGEWMEPWIILQDENGKFKKQSNKKNGLNDMSGWWFSVEKGDLDNDGDMDLILGNLGENYKYQASVEKPFKVFSKDFNNSGSTDIVLSYSQGGKYYPVRGKQCSSQQMPELKSKFKDYNSFAIADVEDIYSDLGLSSALELSASTFASYILKNDNGHFTKIKLPNYAQISSINDMLIDDFDKDGIKDILLVGNLYASEIETTRNDASYGCLIKFDKNIEHLEALKPSETGLFVEGDCKNISKIYIDKKYYIVTAINNGQATFHLLPE